MQLSLLSPCPFETQTSNTQYHFFLVLYSGFIPSCFTISTSQESPTNAKFSLLKVLTNEKRGGLRVISFDRSPFKLFSRKFWKESVQGPSCERHKTTQRTLFLLFASNSWFPMTLLCLAAADFSHHTLNWNNGIVLLPRYLRWREKSGLHNKSFQITLTIHATFGVSAKDQ